jgi:superfamily II DNA or RNA helicase
LAIAEKLGQKTLIIVHTLALRDQWAEEVEKVFGFKPSIYGSGLKETHAPITIGNIQSLTRAPKSTFDKTFGLLIVDECHHIPSTTFSRLVDRSHAKYKIGLSASNRRKDGLHILFQDYFSPKRFTPPAENYMVPSIHRISIPIRFPDSGAWHERLTDLDHNEEYHKMLAMIAKSYASKGHKVLVLSSRTNLMAAASEHDNSSLVIDGNTKERKEIMEEVMYGKDFHTLYGSSNIFAEGVSANPFSCLVLGTPMNNEPLLEQFIGRVIRQHPDKLAPIVVDPQLQGYTVERQQQIRLGYYINKGYKIKNI